MKETNGIYTYEDYLKITDNNRYELIGGELILVPAPKTIHQLVKANLVWHITSFVREYGLGKVLDAPTDVVLSHTDKPQPDILFISASRLDIITEDNIKGAPDLVVEVLSPSTAKYDRVEKSRMYYKYGVKEYWVVDPEIKVIEVYTAGGNNWIIANTYDEKGVLTSPLLKGLQINLGDVF
ncbi:hypothetical protein DCCM_0735 [Desulfocucumis palustris]|uniref:Putative restriction endonuclease domain-containing protein n=1 Tax=Desulfocucumis palustris TaxID=1898651 RepID=A0A2L2X8J4_9FIRM|nr:Uma2 family endonuclease [Desulfocucumis palustris]GBF32539.1 hypothetical protein DCCM_0735 [Desulfocucumis palustris]